jgi:hypothetical protein
VRFRFSDNIGHGDLLLEMLAGGAGKRMEDMEMVAEAIADANALALEQEAALAPTPEPVLVKEEAPLVVKMEEGEDSPPKRGTRKVGRPLSAICLHSVCTLSALCLPSVCPLSALCLPSVCPLPALC